LEIQRLGGLRAVCVIFAAAFLGACASSQARVALPPVTQTSDGTYHTGQFVWHDLVTDDAAAARSFYGELLGWQFQDVEGEGIVYTTILQNGVPIGGIAPIEDEDINVPSARWISLISVPDVDAATAAIQRAGGAVNMEPWDNPTRGRMALVTDPQGAMVIFVRTVSGDPPYLDPDRLVSNRFIFNELWTHDLAASIQVYGDVVGYEVQGPSLAGAPDVRVFTRDGDPRAGLNLLPWPEVQPNWLPYIKVDDTGRIAERVVELGGMILIPPLPQVRNGTVALVADPSGAAFAIQQWPIEE